MSFCKCNMFENVWKYLYTHSIHVWYIYLHLVDFYGKLVGKYTSRVDPMGYKQLVSVYLVYSFVQRIRSMKSRNWEHRNW